MNKRYFGPIIVLLFLMSIVIFGEERLVIETQDNKREISADNKDKITFNAYLLNGSKKTVVKKLKYYDGNKIFDQIFTTSLAGVYIISGEYGKYKSNIIKVKAVAAEKSLLKKYRLIDSNGDVKLDTRYEYDKNGNAVKSINKNIEGVITEKKTEYIYDEKGNIAKSLFRDKDGKVISENEYTYDEKGNNIKFIQKNKDGMIIAANDWEYKYEGGKKLSEKKIIKDRNGNVTSIKETEYDKDGDKKLEHQMTKDKKGETVLETFVYFEDNRKIKEENKNKEGITVKTSIYSYDENLELTLEKAVNKEGKILNTKEYTIEYNKNGLKQSQIMVSKDENNVITGKNKSFYDRLGNMTGYIIENQEGIISEQGEVIYDSKGNIIKEITKDRDGKIISIAESEY